jgi:MoaA/NifB/PqqE/SkfB family radical SAM enzyme
VTDTYTVDKGQEFKQLPEISNIEVCSACNLECPMCLRTTHLGRQPGLVNMKLIKLMHERGDFEGTTYTELQMAGEPTLHPKLFDIIRYLQGEVGVLVGLSTHGLEIEKRDVLQSVLHLDALTISVDSVNPEVYAKMRVPGKLQDLYRNLDLLFGECAELMFRHSNRKVLPMIELQLVQTDLVAGSGDVEALQKVMKEKGWDKYAVIRTIKDCFEGMQDRVQINTTQGLCLNPFTAVSVAHNGDVVSCCMIFTPDPKEYNYYGNLYTKSLKEIWEGQHPKTLQGFMLDHACNRTALPDQCGKCTVRSPNLIHQQIVSRLVKMRNV